MLSRLGFSMPAVPSVQCRDCLTSDPTSVYMELRTKQESNVCRVVVNWNLEHL